MDNITKDELLIVGSSMDTSFKLDAGPSWNWDWIFETGQKLDTNKNDPFLALNNSYTVQITTPKNQFLPFLSSMTPCSKFQRDQFT